MHRSDVVAPQLPSRWSPSLRVPVFCSASQLAADTSWSRYLSWVYSESTLTVFPIDVREFGIFYNGPQLPRAVADASTPLPITAKGAESLPFGSVYTTPHLRSVHGHSYVDYVYVHAFGSSPNGERSPYALAYPRGRPRDSLIEVRHFCCDGCAVGFWMSVAPGSGVYYRMGRTVAFIDRLAACHHYFGVHHRTCLAWGPGRRHVFPPYVPEWQLILGLRWAARRDGYDSIQFIEGPGRGAEIVDLRDGEGSAMCEREMLAHLHAPPSERILTPRDKLVTQYFFAANVDTKWSREEVRVANQTCHPAAAGGGQGGGGVLFFAGWRGLQPCECDGRLGALNCVNAPASQATWLAMMSR